MDLTRGSAHARPDRGEVDERTECPEQNVEDDPQGLGRSSLLVRDGIAGADRSYKMSRSS
jgi:hypothetical protein